MKNIASIMNCHIHFSQPSHANTDIFNSFPRPDNDYVMLMCISHFRSNFLAYMCFHLTSKNSIMRIKFPVMNCRHTILYKIIFYKALPSDKCANLPQFLIRHPIGTEFLDHLTQSAHPAVPSSPSISATMRSISVRRTASRATISRSSALSCVMSMISRVSSGST